MPKAVLLLLLLLGCCWAAPHASKRRTGADEASIPMNSTQASNSLPPKPASKSLPPNSTSAPTKQKTLVDLAGRLYARLGSHKLNATAAALEFKDEYAALEATLVKQPLGASLIALLEVRLADLQASVQHARKMRDVVGLLQQGQP